jgi:hypothetical protein
MLTIKGKENQNEMKYCNFLCVVCAVSSFVQIFLEFRERISTRQNPINLACASVKYEQRGSQRQVEVDERIK